MAANGITEEEKQFVLRFHNVSGAAVEGMVFA